MTDQSQEFSASALVASAFAELKAGSSIVLCYGAAVVGLVIASRFGPAPIRLAAPLLWPVIYFGGLGLMFERMLRGDLSKGTDFWRRCLPLAGLALVMSFSVLVGLNVLIAPGIFLASRWILAPAIVVATPRGVIAALGDSWAFTRGQTKPLMLAVLALLFVPLVGWMVSDDIPASKEDQALIGWSAFHLANVLLAGLSVAVFRIVGADAHRPGELTHDAA